MTPFGTNMIHNEMSSLTLVDATNATLPSITGVPTIKIHLGGGNFVVGAMYTRRIRVERRLRGGTRSKEPMRFIVNIATDRARQSTD